MKTLVKTLLVLTVMTCSAATVQAQSKGEKQREKCEKAQRENQKAEADRSSQKEMIEAKEKMHKECKKAGQ